MMFDNASSRNKYKKDQQFKVSTDFFIRLDIIEHHFLRNNQTEPLFLKNRV